MKIEEKLRGFEAEALTEAQLEQLRDFSRAARGDILKMTMTAGSGHPGGSLSSVDLYAILWHCANITPEAVNDPGRDIVIASHGHTAAAIYAVMGRLGYYDISGIHSLFRQLDGCFDGLPNQHLPGIEWCCGSLGQGLSAGCGYAIAGRMLKQDRHVFVATGDGEQQKGQMTESAELAVKLGLTNLTAIVDYNQLQASGATRDVMPQHLAGRYEAIGWDVLRINGHDFQEIYQALRTCVQGRDVPTLILAETVMGKGVPLIENRFEYHGAVLKDEQYQQALAELGVADDGLSASVTPIAATSEAPPPVETRVQYGTPIEYGVGQAMDNRSAFGAAILDLVKANSGPEGPPIAVLDCDLAPCVRTQGVADQFPDHFIQCGIQEHNTTSVGGGLAKAGVLTFFAEFGVFGLDETYGQHRILDLNDVGFKQIITHCGLDVGEDGKTHQCIDYIALASSLYSYKLICPADPNQTDRALRYIATTPGNFILAMGRSKLPALTDADGRLMYPADSRFEYGKADWLARGTDGVIVSQGSMVHRAMQARDRLSERGVDIGVLNISSPLALDAEAVAEAASTDLVVAYEDHNVRSGLGAMLGAHLQENGLNCTFRRLGISRLGSAGSPDDQYRSQGLDVDTLVATVMRGASRPAR